MSADTTADANGSKRKTKLEDIVKMTDIFRYPVSHGMQFRYPVSP